MPRGRNWTLAEEELLKRYYCVPFRMDVERIAHYLKRTPKAVSKKVAYMKLRRIGQRNIGLREWLKEGGSLILPESVIGRTNITEQDVRDAQRLDEAVRKEWADDSV